MSRTLQGVNRFSLNVEVNGTLDDPRVRLSSDLDGILKNAVGQAAREESARLESALRKDIEGKTGAALANVERSLERLGAVQRDLKVIQVDLEDALKAKTKVKLPI
jgi:hypothetical protein